MYDKEELQDYQEFFRVHFNATYNLAAGNTTVPPQSSSLLTRYAKPATVSALALLPAFGISPYTIGVALRDETVQNEVIDSHIDRMIIPHIEATGMDTTTLY